MVVVAVGLVVVGVWDEATAEDGARATGVDVEADVEAEVAEDDEGFVFVLMVRFEDPVVVGGIFVAKNAGREGGTTGLGAAEGGIDVGAVFGVNVGVDGFLGR